MNIILVNKQQRIRQNFHRLKINDMLRTAPIKQKDVIEISAVRRIEQRTIRFRQRSKIDYLNLQGMIFIEKIFLYSRVDQYTIPIS